MFELDACWDWLRKSLTDESSIEYAKATFAARTDPAQHGDLPKWKAAIEALPSLAENSRLDADSAIRIEGSNDISEESLVATLMKLHPWRKGPWNYFGVEIDTEWRSDLKWNRLADQVDMRGHQILDVGCGNGYYGWRMLAAGAEAVLGCDPTLLYLLQFEASKRYATKAKHWLLPLTDQEIPSDWNFFDTVFSMGVLYHRTSPIDHLLKLKSCLQPGGQLLLETLIIDDQQPNILCPKGRYAKMRNVWMIPSLPMLEVWLDRTGFNRIQVLDDSPTTSQEQRATQWMTFESLSDFLDPSDGNKSIEGYPAPRRAVVLANRRG